MLCVGKQEPWFSYCDCFLSQKWVVEIHQTSQGGAQADCLIIPAFLVLWLTEYIHVVLRWYMKTSQPDSLPIAKVLHLEVSMHSSFSEESMLWWLQLSFIVTFRHKSLKLLKTQVWILKFHWAIFFCEGYWVIQFTRKTIKLPRSCQFSSGQFIILFSLGVHV